MKRRQLDPRVVEMRRLASQAIPALCAIERELTNSSILLGTETMTIGAQTAALRMTLTWVRDHFGEPNVLLPAIRFAPGDPT